MIELVDTHAHLNFADFDKNLKSVLARAKAAGISKIVVPSSELISARKALEISAQFKNVFAAVGVHPLYVIGAGGLFVEDGSPQGFYTKSGSRPTSVFYLKEFEEMLGNKYVIAIGEIGLDYYESPHRENPINCELQLEVLQKNFELAVAHNKPAIVHLRTSKNSIDAFSDFLGVASKFSNKLKAVIHCYSGDLKIAKKLIDAGFYISFTNLTFYNLAIQNTFKKIDLSRVMIETDSPFLSPNNTRCNEPAFLKDIARKLADLRAIKLEELAKITTQNAEKFFGI